ncbi:hypothetical protein HDU98_007219 [Podochytrium sp. JEL0797]|nr:hypothetical protein HDU98_007219 [Podochytrium sp. JEL0797]
MDFQYLLSRLVINADGDGLDFDPPPYREPPHSTATLALDRTLATIPILIAHQLSIILTWSLMTESDLAAFIRLAIFPAMSHPSHSTEKIAQCLESYIRNARWNDHRKKARTQRRHVADFVRLLASFSFSPYTDWSEIKYCWMYQLRVSPTEMWLDGPYVDQTNRVVRQYSDFITNFLQVAFVGVGNSQIGHHMFFRDKGVYAEFNFEGRISHFLRNGISMSGRHFKFLAFSSSSLKEGRFLFFHEPADGSGITVNSIRDWMGDFSMIKIPARYAARMAQALTSTTPTIEIEPREVQMYTADVERNGYVFSDGNGTISPELAAVIWTSLQHTSRKPTFFHDATQTQTRDAVPSAFQIRFGGAKGMISVDPSIPGRMMSIRKSMIKFESPNCRFLEVADYASSSRSAYFNRQVITLLEDLGVPKKVFLDIQRDAIQELSLLHESPERLVALASRIGHFGNFVRLSDNLKIPQWLGNPFVQASLDHVRAHFLKEMKFRCRMKIPQGWSLFGVLDETGVLKEGEVFVSITSDSEPNAAPKILTGSAIVWRNPALHPGDIQPVVAVNCMHLHHLRNVIVFSQHGARDLPSKLAGGDLDGDQFSITQAPTLFPPRFATPGEYIAPIIPTRTRDVTIKDITDFIVHFLKNNNLGVISRRHLILADSLPGGVKHPSCILLSEMASTAVDFAKTGVAANFHNAPRCFVKPDFLCRPNERPRGLYESQRVMGLMFRDRELNRLLNASTGIFGTTSSPGVDPLWTFATSKSDTWRSQHVAALSFQELFDSEMFNIASYCEPALSELELWTGCIDMANRTYHRTAFNLEAWALDQFDALISKTQKAMLEGRSRREVVDLAVACFYVSNIVRQDVETGHVFGLLLFYCLVGV